jgi:transposase-like protein
MLLGMDKRIGPVAGDKSDIIGDVPLACADEAQAVAFMERMRWGDTPACVHCGSFAAYQMSDRKTGQRSRRWLWRCRDCKRQYTVKVGTIMEDSAIPLRHWCFAFWAACAGKKGVSALQIKRQTGLSYKSALYMMHRIRWAMTDRPGGPTLAGTVESDETFVGGKPRKRNYEKRGARKQGPKRGRLMAVMAVVERGGSLRAETAPSVTADTLSGFVGRNVSPKARLVTDEAGIYEKIGRRYRAHETVNHKIHEYARGDVYTNTLEGFFSLLKRQIYGTHHAVSKKHLHRYVSESAFKYNTRRMDDGDRMRAAIKGGDGKRLRYSTPA